MYDDTGHWAEELHARVGTPRRHSVMAALNWFARHDYVKVKRAPDDSCEFVVVGEDRTDHIYVLTDKGRAAAANLDAGYDGYEP
ncbi:hypothetical protein [Nocardia terpenica]|nr:hypothetical protein [Nocardia terpenica]